MNIFVILTFILGVLALGGLMFWLQKKSAFESEAKLADLTRQILEAQKQDQSIQTLQKEMGIMRDQMAKSLTDSAKLMLDSQKTVGERLDRAAHVVGNVQKSLGALDEATKQVFDVGRNISQLQQILKAPKLRGNLGELFLGDLLSQILPPKHFSLQYAFKSGEVVDAVVRLGRLVPVDSKFPLENFLKLAEAQDPQSKTRARQKFVTDVKRHIDAIASKYLRPDEGTFDFALMYIPAENVFYETIIKDDSVADEKSIMAYAFSKKVVPVSPNSFYSYLHTISLGLRGLEIEENARVIIDQLARMRNDFSRFKDDFTLVGKHLNNTRTKYEDAEKRMVRFEDKLTTTGELGKNQSQKIADSPVESLPL